MLKAVGRPTAPCSPGPVTVKDQRKSGVGSSEQLKPLTLRRGTQGTGRDGEEVEALSENKGTHSFWSAFPRGIPQHPAPQHPRAHRAAWAVLCGAGGAGRGDINPQIPQAQGDTTPPGPPIPPSPHTQHPPERGDTYHELSGHPTHTPSPSSPSPSGLSPTTAHPKPFPPC